MQLKKDEDRWSAVTSALYKRIYGKKIVILAVLLIFLAGSFFGLSISGFFGTDATPKSIVKETVTNILSALGSSYEDTALIRSVVIHGNYENLINYANGLESNPERIVIDIKNNDFQKLAYKREIALANGILISSDDDFVPAKIHYNNQTMDVRLRLKGDWIDHIQGDKWSFRIKVKGDNTFFGMKEFSIQDPKTRNYLNEWVFQKAIEKEGIVGLRYFFIDVTVNGKNKGIYALEENFDYRLIEHNGYREGPIIRFDDNLVWLNRLKGTEVRFENYYSSDIDAFQSSRILNNPVQYEQFIKAKDLLESFRNGGLNTSEVFDTDKLAKFMAISYLMGGTHGIHWTNSRFYYNPVTTRLEPIGFDSGSDSLSVSEIGFDSNIDSLSMSENIVQDPYLNRLFKDRIFFEKFVMELERVSQKSYLDDLFSGLDDELQRNIDIIHKDRPIYYFSKDIFYNNQNYIRNLLNPVKGLYAYFQNTTVNSTIVLEVGNIQSMPIEVLDVSYHGSQIFEPREKSNILEGKDYFKTVQYKKIEFVLPKGFNWSDRYISELRLNYRLLGYSRLRNETVIPWSHLSENFLESDFIRQSPNVNEFDFLFADEAAKKIIMKPGNWVINRSLIIPSGYTVTWWGNKTTKLDLRNNATVLSFSPIQFFGSEDYPIVITSSDSTGQGIAVLNAGGRSILNRVVFNNLSAPSQGVWQLSGAVEFYNSDVNINGVEFSDNKFGDDMLHVVRSKFDIRNSLFKHTLSDALDDDFSEGSISHTSFIDAGNDAMDISGALVNITGVYINGTGDKGVSAGEGSHVNIDQIECENCFIAIASKDQSFVDVNNIKISSSNVGLAAYQKKPEFGPAGIAATSVDMMNVTTPYLIEVNSKLSIDGEEITGTQNNVYDMLYGTTVNSSDYSKIMHVGENLTWAASKSK